MYLLIKRGVYRHDVLGCWTGIETANSAGKKYEERRSND